jgi:hypothetical protein
MPAAETPPNLPTPSRPYVRLSLPGATKCAAEHGASGSVIFVAVYLLQRFSHITITPQEAAGMIAYGSPFLTWAYKLCESIFRQWLAQRKIYV